jgi:glycosyltransferase involved in cell wall biosynthesis
VAAAPTSNIPAQGKPAGTQSRRIYQIMECMSYGDAASNITRENARILTDLGYETRIYAEECDPRVAHEATPLSDLRPDARDPIIVHYCGYSRIEEFLESYPGPRAVHFHNITPAQYFDPKSILFEFTNRGHAQLRRIADLFDLVLAPSVFDLDEYARHLLQPVPTLLIPPLVDVERIRQRPVDRAKRDELTSLRGDKFLFVGRVAPNKRHDLLMYAFDEYYREIRRDAYLFLVGAQGQSTSYFDALQRLRADLPSGDRIIFTGHVSEEELAAYYATADVFVCASEHEGFGVPLVEAMAYDVPVIAFNSSAVPEALGDAGILVHSWDSARVAELMNLAIHDKQLHDTVVGKQRNSLSRFSMREVERALAIAVDFLCNGQESPELVWRGPERSAQSQ